MAYQAIPPVSGGTVTAGGGLAGDGSSGDPLTLSPGTLVTLGSDAATIDITGLDGDTDGDYEIVGEIITVATAGSEDYILKPNGSASNCVSSTNAAAGGAVQPQSGTNLIIAKVSANEGFSFRIYFQSTTGRLRLYVCEAYRNIAARQVFNTTGRFTDTATAITSLSIGSSGASNVKAGSWLKWRKLGFTAA